MYICIESEAVQDREHFSNSIFYVGSHPFAILKSSAVSPPTEVTRLSRNKGKPLSVCDAFAESLSVVFQAFRQPVSISHSPKALREGKLEDLFFAGPRASYPDSLLELMFSRVEAAEDFGLGVPQEHAISPVVKQSSKSFELTKILDGAKIGREREWIKCGESVHDLDSMVWIWMVVVLERF
eukprot:TRINITY_DN16154_c0_g1_i1.p2 TRINITY_DN16154_c0_g1~~TRINITY_DN16154_c0_g1_i1.p2  ORF type:complete len:182 (+),score=7.25 TRINITY_DN16154_c0_g1_i1:138-683(+)